MVNCSKFSGQKNRKPGSRIQISGSSIIIIIMLLDLLASFRPRTINKLSEGDSDAGGEWKDEQMDHWKAELSSSVFRRVLNDSSESASRVFELRLFQTVGAPKQKLRLAAADLRKGIRRRCCPSDLRFRDGV